MTAAPPRAEKPRLSPKWLWANFEEVFGVALLAVLCVLCTLQIASRYVIGRQFGWTEECSTITLVWLTFIGSSLALKKGEHFAVDVLVDLFPKVIAKAVRAFVWLCVIAFAMILIRYGGDMAIGGAKAVTPAMKIPRTIPYAAVPVGGAIMLVRSLEGLYRVFKPRHSQPSSPGESGPTAELEGEAA